MTLAERPITMDLKECTHLRELGIRIALRTLPRMLLSNEGPFCLELTKDNQPPRYDKDKSWRYTIMCLLGLIRAQQAGLSAGIDINSIFEHAMRVSAQFGRGDLGLLLWLAVRIRSGHANRITAELESRLADRVWDDLTGMEIAWILTGMAFYTSTGGEKQKKGMERLLDYFFEKRVTPSGLILHLGKGIRSRFPNFATQIYSVHALSICARLHRSERCAQQANVLVERLKKAQRDNGGWPWLYDAKAGLVLEPYEIYGVHQHAMAPMALFEFAEATGKDVSLPVVNGLKWLERRNELQYPMIDEERGLIYRSIRRCRPAHRIVPYSRVAKSCLGLKSTTTTQDDPSGLEVNFTCRPYELGWLLEAWCDRRILAECNALASSSL